MVITDRELNILDRMLPINKDMLNYAFVMPMNFSQYGGKVFLTAPSDYQIYKIDAITGSISDHLYIDFGSSVLQESYYGKHPDARSRMGDIEESAAFNVSSYFESDQFVFFRYQKGIRGSHFYVELKESGESKHFTYEGMHDDLNIGILPRWPLARIENKLIWVGEPSSLLAFVGRKKQSMDVEAWKVFEEENPKLISFANSITSDDNPYLIVTEIGI